MNETSWFFQWVGGGYNTVRASSKKEALKKAKEKGVALEYAPGKMTKTLVPDGKTLVRDPNTKRTQAEDAKYAGMFD